MYMYIVWLEYAPYYNEWFMVALNILIQPLGDKLYIKSSEIFHMYGYHQNCENWNIYSDWLFKLADCCSQRTQPRALPYALECVVKIPEINKKERFNKPEQHFT